MSDYTAKTKCPDCGKYGIVKTINGIHKVYTCKFCNYRYIRKVTVKNMKGCNLYEK